MWMGIPEDCIAQDFEDRKPSFGSIQLMGEIEWPTLTSILVQRLNLFDCGLSLGGCLRERDTRIGNSRFVPAIP